MSVDETKPQHWLEAALADAKDDALFHVKVRSSGI